MPAIIAELVISTGRRRSDAALRAAACGSATGAAILFGEGHQQNCVRDRHTNGHDGSHKALKVEGCAGDKQHQGNTDQNSWRSRDDHKSKTHRLEIRRKQQQDHDDRRAQAD